ncbi:hypothetical protein Aspvir_004405 [Aspergillus viridinutans]|uniref:Uncharacterized protein n=1 Tax=Aspergillus viridinutans TaxID=75553 RepID=A0A9P3BQY3_ASPVI|nr:uncharacterized protein Aspvir_004405 [Aspergillus viridinutans]GIK00382.1 hypothetical protein Aspvir_004405 [Aspergillus viridinutans]
MAQLNLTDDQKSILWSPLPTLRVVPGHHTTHPSDSTFTLRPDQLTQYEVWSLAFNDPRRRPEKTPQGQGQVKVKLTRGLSRREGDNVAVQLARYMDDLKFLNGTYGPVWSLMT